MNGRQCWAANYRFGLTVGERGKGVQGSGSDLFEVRDQKKKKKKARSKRPNT